DRKKLTVIAIAGGVFLVIMIIAIAITRSSEPDRTPHASAVPDATLAEAGSDFFKPQVEADLGSGQAGSAAIDHAAVPDSAGSAAPGSAAPPSRPVAGSAGSAEHEIAIEPEPEHHHHHTEKQDPDQLFKQGVQAYVKGDAKTALGLLLKARGVAPNNAPTWRVLGQVYEKLGDRGAAKNAFLRYLSLSPTAADAGQIRQR